MPKRKKRPRRRATSSFSKPVVREGKADPHSELANELVHIFVDDQNLFWGIVNEEMGPGFRIDFGKLLIAACRTINGVARGVGSAYIAGVIPDDDSFWQIAENQGFKVRRGFLGYNNPSKQDDAYLITDMTATLYSRKGLRRLFWLQETPTTFRH